MTALLAEILKKTREEVSARKMRVPLAALQDSAHYTAPTVSMVSYLTRDGSSGIIAELKRKSPSRGILQESMDVERLSTGYMQAGASALSVLTNGPYFGGSLEDLSTARAFNFCPILRKDFLVDPYQIHEARAAGADTVLLIARCLPKGLLESLSGLARELKLEVLLEIHAESELEGVSLSWCDILGINNRNLNTLEVDTETSRALLPQISKEVCAIAESGISNAGVMHDLRRAGASGFLIGEAFLRDARPAEACARLANDFQKKERAGCV